MAGQADAVLLQETLNRYLLYFPQKFAAGEVLEDVTDGEGCSPLLDTADLDSYKLEVL